MSPMLPPLSKIDMISNISQARLHANAVSLNGQGLLIIGEAKSGKTSLTKALIKKSARNILIADDQTLIQQSHQHLHLNAPKSIQGLMVDQEGKVTRHKFIENIPLSWICLLFGDNEPQNKSVKINEQNFLIHNIKAKSMSADALATLLLKKSF